MLKTKDGKCFLDVKRLVLDVDRNRWNITINRFVDNDEYEMDKYFQGEGNAKFKQLFLPLTLETCLIVYEAYIIEVNKPQLDGNNLLQVVQLSGSHFGMISMELHDALVKDYESESQSESE